MLSSNAAIVLRIMLFRAGPQDLPYSAALTRLVVPATIAALFLQYRLTLPTLQAAVHALAAVAVVAAYTHLLLQARGLLNRLQQTLNSLYITGSAMTLLLLPMLSALAPHMLRIAENPELARSEPLPGIPALAVVALSVWNFLISAHIYRHALDTRFGVGALVALLGVIVTISIAGALSALVG